MSFWAVAKLRREALALYCLGLRGYSTYLPRLRVHRIVRGRKIERRPLSFPGYIFILIEGMQWYDARSAPGIAGMIMDGIVPARLPPGTIDAIRQREVDGLIELKRQGLRRGDRVKILKGLFAGHRATYHGRRSRDRIEVLLQLLGSTRSATLESLDVEPAK